MSVSAEEFVKIWQSSESVAQVADQAKMRIIACHVRAANYRRIGVKLKKMKPKGRPKLDVAALNKLCK